MRSIYSGFSWRNVKLTPDAVKEENNFHGFFFFEKIADLQEINSPQSCNPNPQPPARIVAPQILSTVRLLKYLQ